MNKITRWTQKRQWEQKYTTMLSQIGDKPAVRVEAHAKNLDEYWLRWLGFCRLETVAPQSLIDNALFLVVEAASKIAGGDIAKLEHSKEASVRQSWNEYEKSLIGLRKVSPKTVKNEAEESYLKFKAFVDAFHKNYD